MIILLNEIQICYYSYNLINSDSFTYFPKESTTTTTRRTTLTLEESSVDSGNFHFLVMANSLDNAVIISENGNFSRVKISGPSNDYVKGGPNALIKDEFYIFGGWSGGHKVRIKIKKTNSSN